MHPPTADAKPQYRFALPRHPDVIVRKDARSGRRVVEQLVAVSKGDVDDGGLVGYGAKAFANERADLKGIVRIEVVENDGGFLGGDPLELSWEVSNRNDVTSIGHGRERDNYISGCLLKGFGFHDLFVGGKGRCKMRCEKVLSTGFSPPSPLKSSKQSLWSLALAASS
jgi:hypothetical protein